MKILVVQESDLGSGGYASESSFVERLSSKGHEVGVIDYEWDLHHPGHTPGGDQDVACGAGVRAVGAGLVYDLYGAGVFL